MRARRTVRPLAVALVALVAVAGAACSSAGEQVSEKISKQAESVLKLAAPPTTTCPKDAKAKKGEKFTCTLTIEGSAVPVKVSFVDDQHFTFTPQSQVFEKPALETRLKTFAKTKDIVLKSLDCPGTKYVIIANAGTVDCKGVDQNGDKGTFVVGLDSDHNPIVQSIKAG